MPAAGCYNIAMSSWRARRPAAWAERTETVDTRNGTRELPCATLYLDITSMEDKSACVGYMR